MNCLRKINPDLESRIIDIGVKSTVSYRNIDGKLLCSRSFAENHKFSHYSKRIISITICILIVS